MPAEDHLCPAPTICFMSCRDEAPDGRRSTLSLFLHWNEHRVRPRLQHHRQHQQDALQYSWDGLIAGTDGSVDEKTESIGAG
jgi:hypothetical protein